MCFAQEHVSMLGCRCVRSRTGSRASEHSVLELLVESLWRHTSVNVELDLQTSRHKNGAEELAEEKRRVRDER